MIKFKLGKIVVTQGVSDFIKENNIDMIDVYDLIFRHGSGDWGDIPKEDKKLNDRAIENGDRLLSSYKLKDEKIWIITEADRSITTILFPDEY